MTARFEHAHFLEQPDYTLEDIRRALRALPWLKKRFAVVWESWMRGARVDEADLEKARQDSGIIDSMTSWERLDTSLIGPSQIHRIAHGAGVEPQRVEELLDRFADMAAVITRLRRPRQDTELPSAPGNPPPFWEGN